MGEHEVGSHEASEAPAVHADAVLIHVGEALEVLDTLHLIGHLGGADLTMDDLLEGGASLSATAVVQRKDDIPLLCHVEIPARSAPLWRIGDELSVRASVDVDDGGVLLHLVEVRWRDKAVVQLGLAISR